MGNRPLKRLREACTEGYLDVIVLSERSLTEPRSNIPELQAKVFARPMRFIVLVNDPVGMPILGRVVRVTQTGTRIFFMILCPFMAMAFRVRGFDWSPHSGDDDGVKYTYQKRQHILRRVKPLGSSRTLSTCKRPKRKSRLITKLVTLPRATVSL